MNEAQNQGQPGPAPDDLHTDMSVGEILRRTRTHYGQTLEQIGQILRIRASQLEALETGDVEKLPGRVYAIGFVRSYSEYLGLDGDKMVYLFKNQSVGSKAKPELQFPVAANETKVPTLPIIGIGLGLCVVTLVIAGLFFFTRGSDDVIPAVPVEMQQQTLNEAPSIIQPSPDESMLQPTQGEETQSSASSITRVVVTVEANSWVEIRDAKGEVLISQVLKPGDQYLVPNEPGMVLSTGNAGGISVTLDGKELPKIGEPAQVKRNVSLDPSDLLKLR